MYNLQQRVRVLGLIWGYTPCRMTRVTLHSHVQTPVPLSEAFFAHDASLCETERSRIGQAGKYTYQACSETQGYLAHTKQPPPPLGQHTALGMVLL